LYYLEDFIKIRKFIQDNNYRDLPYFFHAGETDWFKSKEENLFDAILLNTSRIGHGLALKGYPLLMEIVKRKGIGLEVSPISNQLLRFVNDLRNHPAVTFMANGLPVTLSSDDPVVYGYTGVSYDFYEAYMAWQLSLAGLKQLTQNSITYSSLTPQEKTSQLRTLDVRWHRWIDFIVDGAPR